MKKCDSPKCWTSVEDNILFCCTDCFQVGEAVKVITDKGGTVSFPINPIPEESKPSE